MFTTPGRVIERCGRLIDTYTVDPLLHRLAVQSAHIYVIIINFVFYIVSLAELRRWTSWAVALHEKTPPLYSDELWLP